MNLADQWEELPKWLTDLDPNVYLHNDFVVVDFETTNLDYGHWRNKDNSLVLACWYRVRDGRIKKYSHWGSEFDQAKLLHHCNNAKFLVAHNAQFELGWLDRCGFDIASKPVFCTQIAEWVLSGNRQWAVSLEDCLRRRRLGGKESVVSKMIKSGISVLDIPKRWVDHYCRLDVKGCFKLFMRQRATLLKHNQLPVLFARCMFSAPLADIATNGMCLDQERVIKLFESKSKELNELEAKFAELTGNINPKSNPQMVDYLYKTLGFEVAKDYRGNPMMTPRGDSYSTDTRAMDALKARNKKQREFLDLRKALVKARDTMAKYVRHFHNCVVDNDDHILYADFNQTRTQTHRLSSSGSSGYRVQFQNIDRDYKPIFTTREPGWAFAEHDEGQLEYRCAVDMGDDENGKQDIKNKVDAHAFTANIIFSKEWKNAQKEANESKIKKIRTDAKAHTFKPLYGGSSGTASQQRYYKAFKQKHTGITAWQESNISTVLQSGKLRIPSGLVFYWPDTRVTHSGYIVNTAMICNYPVQSFATADIVPIGVTFFWHRLRAAKMRSFLVNTVHDSALGEVDPVEKEQYDEIGKTAMTKDVLLTLDKLYNYKFTTPLECEGEYYTHWTGGTI